MAVDLPTLPRGTKFTVRPVRFDAELTSVMGGSTQILRRLGTRFGVDVELPTMGAACAAALVAARLRANTLGEVLRLPVPQYGDGAALGSINATAGAVNSALVSVTGAKVADIKPGMVFSFAPTGRCYLHMVTVNNGATLEVAPLLRASPAGLGLNFASPVIEGTVDGSAWSVELLRFIGQSFSLNERR